MRIAAALAWYMEPPGFLDRCIRSLAAIADVVVTCDGAWRWFPDASPCSPQEQHATIARACLESGLVHVALEPCEVWESQVAKRAALMEYAGGLADWVFVIDGDEYVTRCDGDLVRARLEATDLVMGAVEITNLHRGGVIPGYHPEGGMKRRLYRAGTTCVVVHSGYAFDGRYLYQSEDAVDLADCLRLEHDNCNRGDARNAAAIEYRAARERERVEVWV